MNTPPRIHIDPTHILAEDFEKLLISKYDIFYRRIVEYILNKIEKKPDSHLLAILVDAEDREYEMVLPESGYEKSLNNYYNKILDYIHYINEINDINKTSGSTSTPPVKLAIPSSIFWATDDLTEDKIKEKMTTYKKKMFIYENRIQSIEKSRENILKYCQDFYKQITPNYDVEKIHDLNYNIDKVVYDFYYDRVDDNETIQSIDWMVFKNKNNDNELYSAIANGLNRQLDLTKSTTSNQYTEKKNGKNLFTNNFKNRIIFFFIIFISFRKFRD